MDSILFNNPAVKKAAVEAFANAVDFQEFGRVVIEALLNALISARADEACGASYGERSESRTNARNGYRDRSLTTSAGDINVRIPKLRTGSFFPADILERYNRIDASMASIVAEIYVSGVSTRKVREIAEIMGVSNISKSQVSELCSVLDEEVEQFRLRDFSGDKFPYLWLDATWMKCRVDGRMVSQAVVTAIALNSQGFKKMVGIDCVDTESYESWKEFLSGLKSRGVSGVVLVVSDQHAGLVKAINEVFVGASHQRCITHLQRNVKSHIHKKSDQRAATVALRTAFTQTNPLLARMCYQEACRRITMLSRTAGSVVEEAENEALAYLTFPKKHWSKIKTNNIQERTNRELKRRYRTVQSFPSRCALLRLIGSVAIREEERWETHRMFSPSSTGRAWTCTEAREYDPAEIASARATAEDLIAKAIDGAMEKE